MCRRRSGRSILADGAKFRKGNFPRNRLHQNASPRKPGPWQPKRAAGCENEAEERLRRPQRPPPRGSTGGRLCRMRRGGPPGQERCRRGKALPAPFLCPAPGRSRAACRFRASGGRFRRLQSGPLWRMLPHVLFNIPFRRDFLCSVPAYATLWPPPGRATA